MAQMNEAAIEYGMPVETAESVFLVEQVDGYTITAIRGAHAADGAVCDIRLLRKRDGKIVPSGVVTLYPDGAALPVDRVMNPTSDGRQIVLNAHFAQFSAILHLIKHEQNARIYFTGPSWTNGVAYLNSLKQNMG